jgi:hypothetical protein
VTELHQGYLNDVIASVLIGLAMVGLGGLAWAGVWRRWAAWDGPPAYNVPITVLPGLGLMVVAAGLDWGGLGNPVTNVLGAAGVVGGLVLYFWRPKWWGPRWYRERLESGEIRLDLARSANVLAPVVEGGPVRGKRVAGWWRARLLDGAGEVPGTLVLYRTAMAFGALHGPNRLLVIPGGEVLSARAEDSRLVLTLRDGQALRFRLRSPERAARKVARTLTP